MISHKLPKKLPGATRKKTTYTIALLLIALAWWWFDTPIDTKPVASPTRVAIAPAIRQDVPMLVPLVGTVVPYETVSIKSRLDSQITEVRFHDGDFVKEGQVMFELDGRAIQAQIEQLQAALQKEKAQLINTNLQYQRTLKLIKTNVVSQSQVDDAKAAYETQLAQVNAAQANLDNERVQLTYATITAPISGRTGTINATRGNNVKTNDAVLVTINQITPIRVQSAIPQRYYDQVKAALAHGNITVKAQNKESNTSVDGKLEYVDNNIDVSNGTFAARAVFSNEDEKLWPGMFVGVTLDMGLEKNVLTIPSVAVQGDEGKHFVFTYDADKKVAVRKPVEISRNNGELVIVSKGLEDTDQVIVDGLLRVSDGAPVEMIPVPPPVGGRLGGGLNGQ